MLRELLCEKIKELSPQEELCFAIVTQAWDDLFVDCNPKSILVKRYEKEMYFNKDMNIYHFRYKLDKDGNKILINEKYERDRKINPIRIRAEAYNFFLPEAA